MLKLLLVTSDEGGVSDFGSALQENDKIELLRAKSAKTALDIVSENAIDLVVADENLDDMTGLELAGKLVLLNPMINCAVISNLSQESFHEASEGLGLMAQLPKHPSGKDAEKLLRDLKSIKESLA